MTEAYRYVVAAFLLYTISEDGGLNKNAFIVVCKKDLLQKKPALY
jgi:hypothetical protein